MKAKKKCQNCKLLIDDDMNQCPYCGFVQDSVKEVKQEQRVEENKETPKRGKFFDFPNRSIILPTRKYVTLFLSVFLLIRFVGVLFTLITAYLPNWYFIYSGNYLSAIEFALYLILFAICILIIGDDIRQILNSFTNKNVVLRGIAFGFAALIITSAVSSFFGLFGSGNANANEEAIDNIAVNYPILSLLVFGIIGPITEEFGYRVGLFSLIRKYNRVLAYILTPLIFGLIHFTITGGDIINELLNLPAYIVAGLLFSYIYEYKGFAASSIAHITNNVIALTIQIIIRKL